MSQRAVAQIRPGPPGIRGLLPGGLRALPVAARWWWAAIVLAAFAVLPWLLAVEQPHPPAVVPWLVALLNALLVVVTAHRRRQASLEPTFDYGGVATVTVLVLCGPTVALVAFAGEKLAAALVRNAGGQRPALTRSIFNLAWGAPALACAWAAGMHSPDAIWTPLIVGATWWLVNGLLVGPMVAFGQRKSWADGVRLALTNDVWLRAQETILMLFAVLAWHSHPALIGAVALLIVGQATTSRRLLTEFEATAVAREEAQGERRRAEAEATRARLDPLTQLPNRHALGEELEAPRPRPAVVMIDLDHFKLINDQFGHDAGDAVLVHVAHAIRGILGPDDFCARMGGEEFCVLLADIGTDADLLEVTERVRNAIAVVRPEAFPRVNVTASVGALRVPPGKAVVDALRSADQALYRAKADGRNRVRLAP
ncbi:MAG TPA: GGDEF domain-containing protein [Chloroflexota bacterium]|nr:GGDEF domain-containing protein [Chloroflexota bacterium]